MFDLSRVSSKLSDGDAALVVTASCLFVSVLFMWYTGRILVSSGMGLLTALVQALCLSIRV